MFRATKVRIYPTESQAQFLKGQFGAVRFVYNKALYLKSRAYRKNGTKLNIRKDIEPLLPIAKKSRKYSWLAQYEASALVAPLNNLKKAFDAFFSPKLKGGYPKFKSKNGKQSSYHYQSVYVFDDSIKIPKLGKIKAKIHREIVGSVRSITISLSPTGKFYASILADDGVPEPENKQVINKAVGIDLGLSHYLIESNGRKTENPRFLKNAERNLKRKQRQLSRKKKGSANRAKARLLVAKCHEKLTNKRNDFQHKLSKTIADENQAVIVETLKSANMMKNKKLAKHIGDAAWYGFVSKLEYKLKVVGKHFIKVDQWFASSKTCSSCGYKAEEMPLSVRKWDCPSCGAKDIDRDINAAINIKKKGIFEIKAAGLSSLLMEAA